MKLFANIKMDGGNRQIIGRNKLENGHISERLGAQIMLKLDKMFANIKLFAPFYIRSENSSQACYVTHFK